MVLRSFMAMPRASPTLNEKYKFLLPDKIRKDHKTKFVYKELNIFICKAESFFYLRFSILFMCVMKLFAAYMIVLAGVKLAT